MNRNGSFGCRVLLLLFMELPKLLNVRKEAPSDPRHVSLNISQRLAVDNSALRVIELLRIIFLAL